jgi:hypothetical protein
MFHAFVSAPTRRSRDCCAAKQTWALPNGSFEAANQGASALWRHVLVCGRQEASGDWPLVGIHTGDGSVASCVVKAMATPSPSLGEIDLRWDENVGHISHEDDNI